MTQLSDVATSRGVLLLALTPHRAILDLGASWGHSIAVLEYRIHPSVGVARMGDSPTHFTVAAEPPGFVRSSLRQLDDPTTPGDDPLDSVPAKDPSGHLVKQAARFRVFAYHWADDDPEGLPTDVWEVTAEHAQLEWQVRVANRKAGVDEPNAPDAVTLDGRDPDYVGQRRSMAAPDRLGLGSVALDADGTLLVIGGDGAAELEGDPSHVPDWLEHNPSLDPEDASLLGLDHEYNGGWVDDAGDGWVAVTVHPVDGHHDGLEPTYRPAWVVLAPPDFAPDAPHLVSLHDVLLDRAEARFAAVRWFNDVDLGLRSPDPDLDVARLLRAMTDLRWLTPFAADTSAPQAVDALAKHPHASSLADAPAAERGLARSLLAPHLTVDTGPEPIYRPLATDAREWSEARGLLATDTPPEPAVLPWARHVAMPRVMSRWLDMWSVEPERLTRRSPERTRRLPAALDEAHLRSMVGGPFRPGIEVGADALRAVRWSFRRGATHGHVDVRVEGDPGDLTFDLGVPWQVTYQRDQERWWPTIRPVEVVPDGADAPVAFDRDEATGGRLNLLERWHELGVVRRRAGDVLRETGRLDPAEAARPPWAVDDLLGTEAISGAMEFYASERRSSALRSLAPSGLDIVRGLLGVGPQDLERTDDSLSVSEVFVQRVAGFQRVQLTETTIDGRLGEGTLAQIGLGPDADDPPPGWNAAGLGRDAPDPALEDYATGTSFAGKLFGLLGTDAVIRAADIRERDGVAVVGLDGLTPALELTVAMVVSRLVVEEDPVLFEEALGAAPEAVVAALGLTGEDVSLAALIATADMTALCRLLAHPAAVAAQLRWYEQELVTAMDLARNLTAEPAGSSVDASFGATALVMVLGYEPDQSPTAGDSDESARAAQVLHATDHVRAASDDDRVGEVAEVVLRRCFGGVRPRPAWPDVWSELLASTEPPPEPETLTRVIRLFAAFEALWDEPVALDVDFHALLRAASPEPARPAGPHAGDPELAVTPFDQQPFTEILSDAEHTKAVDWTKTRFTVAGQSGKNFGILLGELESAIGRYIDLAQVLEHLRASHDLDREFNQLDIVVEGVHQFQRRVFDPQHDATECGDRRTQSKSPFDGHAGVMALDSLGLFHRKLSSLYPDSPLLKGNDAALARLALTDDVRSAKKILEAAGYTSTNWFDHMVNPSFLGRTFRRSNGIHIELLRALREAERALLDKAAYRGMSPAELGVALEIEESHAGARPGNGGTSIHLYGMALDIDYCLNPWITGSYDNDAANEKFQQVFRRAARAVPREAVEDGEDGEAAEAESPIPDGELTPTALHGLADRENVGTEKADAWIRAEHRRFVTYLTGDGGKEDVARLRAAPTNFVNHRDPTRGFHNLHRDLVIALRDDAELAWGAIDLGDSQNGDMMHFDVRSRAGLGALINGVRSDRNWTRWRANNRTSGE